MKGVLVFRGMKFRRCERLTGANIVNRRIFNQSAANKQREDTTMNILFFIGLIASTAVVAELRHRFEIEAQEEEDEATDMLKI